MLHTSLHCSPKIAILFFDDRNEQFTSYISPHNENIYIVKFASIDKFAIGALRTMQICRKEQASGILFIFLRKKGHVVVPPDRKPDCS